MVHLGLAIPEWGKITHLTQSAILALDSYYPLTLF